MNVTEDDYSPMQSKASKSYREQQHLNKEHILYHNHLFLCLSPALTRKGSTAAEHKTTGTHASPLLSTLPLHRAAPQVKASHGGYHSGAGGCVRGQLLPSSTLHPESKMLALGQRSLSKHGK